MNFFTYITINRIPDKRQLPSISSKKMKAFITVLLIASATANQGPQNISGTNTVLPVAYNDQAPVAATDDSEVAQVAGNGGSTDGVQVAGNEGSNTVQEAGNDDSDVVQVAGNDDSDVVQVAGNEGSNTVQEAGTNTVLPLSYYDVVQEEMDSGDEETSTEAEPTPDLTLPNDNDYISISSSSSTLASGLLLSFVAFLI